MPMGLSEMAGLLPAMIEARWPSLRARKWEKNGKLRLYLSLRQDGHDEPAWWFDFGSGRQGGTVRREDSSSGMSPPAEVARGMEAVARVWANRLLVIDDDAMRAVFLGAGVATSPARTKEPAGVDLYEALGCSW